MNDQQWEKFISEQLGAAGKNIQPPRELLVKIISAVNAPADLKSARPVDRENRLSLFNFISPGKIFFSAAAITALIVIFLSFPFSLKNVRQAAVIGPMAVPSSPAESSANVAVQNNYNNPPLTTDDVDAASTAILASADDEDSTFDNNVDEESLSAEDNAAIDNLIQNYDQE
ncbi:MAG TPA: hypothetical protein VMC41_00870 [Candidatus Nanoarchaeia archaeon]|nr:hypothetical protein [Candidatus Nanoarchaeia archaeon]